jgi:hypothetical protein
MTIAVAGNVFGIVLPFFFLPEPHRFVDPMAYAILMWLFYLIALVVGVPASLITMRQHRLVGWVTLLGCVLMLPLSLAAVRVAGWFLGIPVSFG